MAFTLWRGDRLLGELCPRHEPELVSIARARPQLSALLLPVDDAPEVLTSVWQVRFDRVPGGLVLEHSVDPIVAGEPRREWPDRPTVRAYGKVATGGPDTRVVTATQRPLREDERRGVPPERRLAVRDAAGRVLAARHVILREFRPAPGTEETVLAGYAAGVLSRGRVWLVFAAVDPDEAVA